MRTSEWLSDWYELCGFVVCVAGAILMVVCLLVFLVSAAFADELVFDSRGRLGLSFDVNGFGDTYTTFGNGESYYTMPLGPDTSRTVDDRGRSWIVVEEPKTERDD